MKQKLIDALIPLGFPVLLKGTIAPKDYPDDIILFWNFSSENTSFENGDYVTNWGFEIRYLSNNPLNVENNKKLILKTLKDAGFIADGKGYDIATDTSTPTVTGWGCDFYFLEVNNNG